MTDLVQLRYLEGIEIIKVDQFANTEHDRPEFQNKYLKILYFIIREGIKSSLRKYWAHNIPQVRYLTFVEIMHNKKSYINVSLQFTSNKDKFVVENKFYAFSIPNYDNFSENVDYYLSHINQFANTVDYSILGIDSQDSISFKTVLPIYSEIYKEGLFIFGLGGYVNMFIIRHFKKMVKIGCVDYKPIVSDEFKKRYGFKYSFVSAAHAFLLLKNVEKPVVIIASFHSDHAALAYETIKNNPNAIVFIEKPPIVTLEDLSLLLDLYHRKANLEIGFNRRFIAFNQYVKNKVKGKKIYITCSVKEVLISTNHWYLWKNQGTRITGNAVHWFDLANFWIDSMPVEINLMADPVDCESSAISVLYKNGSVLSLMVTDQGNSMRGVQEKIEIRFENETIFIDDYLSLAHIHSNGIQVKKFRLQRDKGHNRMYRNFKKILKGEAKSAYTAYDMVRTSLVTYYASDMLVNNIRNRNIENEMNHYLNMIEDLDRTDFSEARHKSDPIEK